MLNVFQTNILKQFFGWLSLTWQFGSITCWRWWFSNIDNSQGNVATYIRCSGIFKWVCCIFNIKFANEGVLKIGQNLGKLRARVYCRFFTHSVVFGCTCASTVANTTLPLKFIFTGRMERQNFSCPPITFHTIHFPTTQETQPFPFILSYTLQTTFLSFPYFHPMPRLKSN